MKNNKTVLSPEEIVEFYANDLHKKVYTLLHCLYKSRIIKTHHKIENPKGYQLTLMSDKHIILFVDEELFIPQIDISGTEGLELLPVFNLLIENLESIVKASHRASPGKLFWAALSVDVHKALKCINQF